MIRRLGMSRRARLQRRGKQRSLVESGFQCRSSFSATLSSFLGGNVFDPHENYAAAVSRTAFSPVQDYAAGISVENAIKDISLVFKTGGRGSQGSQERPAGTTGRLFAKARSDRRAGLEYFRAVGILVRALRSPCAHRHVAK